MPGDYWLSDNVFNREEIEKINSLVKKVTIPNVDVKKVSPAHIVTKTSKVSVFQWGNVINALWPVEDRVRTANTNEFAYDIFPFDSSQILLHSTYENGAEYDWHYDGNVSGDPKPTDVKLTVIVNLSEKEYTGGDFLLKSRGSEHKININMGGILIFKSWLFHRVTPVTAGERISITTWAVGPKFR